MQYTRFVICVLFTHVLQPCDWPSASVATLLDMGTWITLIN